MYHACPHGVVSGQCNVCLAETLEQERRILGEMRALSRCTCTTSATETPGVRRYLWDPDCPQHLIEE